MIHGAEKNRPPPETETKNGQKSRELGNFLIRHFGVLLEVLAADTNSDLFLILIFEKARSNSNRNPASRFSQVRYPDTYTL